MNPNIRREVFGVVLWIIAGIGIYNLARAVLTPAPSKIVWQKTIFPLDANGNIVSTFADEAIFRKVDK